MDISAYLEEVRKQYATGQATEHSYRPALYSLFASIDPDLKIINEPKKSDAGMPDFLFERKGVPVGWAEAKDIDKDVIKLKGYSVEQRKRYENAYPNLLYTNGVDFEFIREGESVHFVSIADFMMGLQPAPERFEELERQLRLFAEQKPISVRSAARLAEMMAAKAAIIKDEIGIALGDDPDFRSDLGGQFKSFQQNLLPNLTPAEFADIYAETITYGMFAARFHDDDLETFSRQEALEKLPASNPFLKGLFRYIAGPNLPKRLEYIVDDLVQLMRASDPHSLFRDFGKFSARNDPFIHFYEDFLAAYNPDKRKSRGVWYTPEPVVDFIVRAVDEVLKTEFGLPLGLADNSKVTVDWDTGRNHPKTGKPVTEKREVHRVQILDPATGTGTFLAKTVQLIADRVKARAPGKWSSYVEEELLPRLHGFELLMASYAMCHMKLDMMLDQTGYKPSARPPRLSVWLSNTLEPAEREVRDLFFQPLAEEARGASEVKRQTPIMCVIGNPPYSGISQNNGEWITGLIEDYKYVDGVHFGERKHWLQDDYVKFIRFAESMIAKNGEGVLGFITNHGYLDNPTFRGMRWHLMKTFDRIYVLDLHGNAKKKEVSPDGSPDKNVFDIQQGVAIVVAVKHRSSGKQPNSLAQLRHGDLWGARDNKYAALWEGTAKSLIANSLPHKAPQYAFVPRDYATEEAYKAGFAVSALMAANVTGIVTAKDALVIDFTQAELKQKISRFIDPSKSDAQVRNEFFPGKKEGKYPAGDSRGWKLPSARVALRNDEWQNDIKDTIYRPLDKRAILYRPDMVDWGRFDFMGHIVDKRNIALITPKIKKEGLGGFITEFICGHKTYDAFDSNSIFPLYLYPDEQDLDQSVRVNFDAKLYAQIRKAAGLTGPNPQTDTAIVESGDFRKLTGAARPDEVKVFDYIYGVLHCPAYRETYAEFLKIDFPRVPFPPSPEVFRTISEQGEALRRLHLMEDAAIGDPPYAFKGEPPEGQDSVVDKPRYESGRIYINGTGEEGQYFDAVPPVAWDFPIGGYQPAQKWLKDRKRRTLSIDDIYHYQKIITVLAETDRIMQEIELPLAGE